MLAARSVAAPIWSSRGQVQGRELAMKWDVPAELLLVEALESARHLTDLPVT